MDGELSYNVISRFGDAATGGRNSNALKTLNPVALAAIAIAKETTATAVSFQYLARMRAEKGNFRLNKALGTAPKRAEKVSRSLCATPVVNLASASSAKVC